MGLFVKSRDGTSDWVKRPQNPGLLANVLQSTTLKIHWQKYPARKLEAA